MLAYQVYSRKNDPNGNPFRLLVVYQCDVEDGCRVVQAYEARSSTPNIERVLRRRCSGQLAPVHMQPREYRDLRTWVATIVPIERED